MKRRTLPVATAFAATAVLLLTACGEGDAKPKEDAKIAGADTGAGSDTGGGETSAPPSAEAPSTTARPKITLLNGVKDEFANEPRT